MSDRTDYQPGAATGAEIHREGDSWTLVLVRTIRHSPDVVWGALTEPDQLRQWAPFDADRNLGFTGPATLTTVGAPAPVVDQTEVTLADRPRALEYSWGGNRMRWELEPTDDGTRLTLWHSIDRRYIAMGAAGWHICFDVLDRLLRGDPIGRLVGGDAVKFGGWQRLYAEYSTQFGVRIPEQ